MVEPEIDTSDVQGNVMPGFFKPCQCFLGFRIGDLESARALVSALASQVTTADEVFLFRDLRGAMRRRRGVAPGPDQLSCVWISLSFSADALRHLVAPDDVNAFEDEAFKIGLLARSSLLGDPTDGEGSPETWKVGGKADDVPHLLVLIAGDRLGDVAGQATDLKKSGADSGLNLVYEEYGQDLPGDLAGHEHFGFKDGISQPGIRGRLKRDPHPPITPRLIDPSSPFVNILASPGQPLVQAGQFLFGYPREHDQIPGQTLPRREAPDWAHNGSLLVFRRLRQDVKTFWEFMETAAADISGNAGFSGLDADHLAALLVGRWADGAPIARTPDRDDSRFAAPHVANNFRFNQAGPKIPFDPATMIPEDTLARSKPDHGGFICPHAAHIRKVNPRDIVTEQGSSQDTLQRRILRRGLPFGTVRPHRTQGDDPENGNRGLLFLCYQTSIVDQFEFLSVNWMNEVQAPEENPGGHDMILGQNAATGANRERRCTLRRRDADGTESQAKVSTTRDWVIPSGGGYFFTPSIRALREVIGKEPGSQSREAATRII